MHLEIVATVELGLSHYPGISIHNSIFEYVIIVYMYMYTGYTHVLYDVPLVLVDLGLLQSSR